MIEPIDSVALTPDDPTFAVIVINETRALIKQVTAWARDLKTSMDSSTIADLAVIAKPTTEPQ